jgi:hypothetical protein
MQGPGEASRKPIRGADVAGRRAVLRIAMVEPDIALVRRAARRTLDFDRLGDVQKQAKGADSPPLRILGAEADASLGRELANLLSDLGAGWQRVDPRFDDPAFLADAVETAELVMVVVARPESIGADLVRLVDRIVAARGRERVVVAVAQGTYSGALLDLDRKKGIPLLDLGRRLEPGSEAVARLRKRVAVSLIAAMPLDLPASLYRTAIHQRSIAVLAEKPSLAASQPIRDWDLARPGDGGIRPNALWSSWLGATASAELARLGTHLDELRVHALLRDEEQA